MNKTIKKNYIYNLIYEAFMLIVPIAVTPYISRVLGEDASGQYSYIYSIVTYFTLFASLGFSRYSQRLVAQHQGNKYKQSIDFYEIFIARLIPVTLTIMVYLIIWNTGIYGQKYNGLVVILSINIYAIAIDITYLFQGNEEFGILVLRNILVKSMGFLCIFIFVKSAADLWKYAFIQSMVVMLSNLSLWLYLPKYIIKIKISELKPLRHLPATFMLFIPTIATSIYTSLDKTLIGLITQNDAENGNYEYAEKLVKMAQTIITSLGTVMIPRNSVLFSRGNFEKIKENIYFAMRFVMLLGLPLSTGLIAISNNLIPWYLGDGYNKAADILKILSPLIVIIGISNVLGVQFLLPSGEDKKYTLALVLGACINLILNLIFINKLGSYGAAIATIIAELLITICMCYFVRNDIKLKKILEISWHYIVASILMFGICFTISTKLEASIFNTFFIILCGIIIYFIILLCLNDEIIRYITKINIKNKY